MNDKLNLTARGWKQDAQGNWTHPSRLVDSVPAAVTESARGPALGAPIPAQKKARPHVARRGGKPSLLITLTACRRPDARRDGDNWAEAGYKELRDVIAKWFGLDDNDRFIKWQYRNLDTIGQQGTIVTMEKL